jgi:hypothetical protein
MRLTASASNANCCGYAAASYFHLLYSQEVSTQLPADAFFVFKLFFIGQQPFMQQLLSFPIRLEGYGRSTS